MSTNTALDNAMLLVYEQMRANGTSEAEIGRMLSRRKGFSRAEIKHQISLLRLVFAFGERKDRQYAARCEEMRAWRLDSAGIT